MSVIVRVLASADGGPNPHAGRYVLSWDPHTRFGTLAVTSTDDPRAARLFADAGQVHREWRMISKAQPWRPNDRKPNRPLTGITVEIEPAP